MIPRALRNRRRTFLLVLAYAALTAAVAAVPAFGDALTPESGGSPNADRVDTLYKIVFIMSIPIFLLVEGSLIYALVKFRRRRHDPEPVQIEGNAALELGWTLAAAAIVVIIAVVTFAFLPGILDPDKTGNDGLQRAQGVQFATVGQADVPGGKELRIHVNGQQYLWRFDYVGEKPLGEGRPVYAYTDMYVPVNTTVTLKIYASDVIHSWWIPKLGGKADATPGHTNETWFKIKKPGIYKGQCAEFCGENHADMRARVIAVPVDEYQAWVERQRTDILDAQKALAAQRKSLEGKKE